MSKKILIVDDEVSICELLQTELSLESYECAVAYDALSALETFKSFQPELVILDVMLPQMSGYEVCEAIRKIKDVPVIMLSAKAETADKIAGLNIGADDYITKPFETSELLARIKALIRRSHDSVNKVDIYKNGVLSVIPSSQSVYIGNKQVKLTVSEFELLMLFMKNKNVVLSRRYLAEQIGQTEFDEDTRAIDMHIQRLRHKLSSHTNTKLIETIFGLGYKMRNYDEAEI